MGRTGVGRPSNEISKHFNAHGRAFFFRILFFTSPIVTYLFFISIYSLYLRLSTGPLLRKVCSRLKEIIDSSTLLQYLIELHRDGFIPFPCGRREFRVRSLYAGGNSARESSENMKIDGYADKRLSSTTASLATTTSTTRDRVKANAIDLLNNLLNRRKRWSDFHLYPPRRCPPDDTQFRLYEFCGGYLAHCQGGEQTDSIIFQNLSKAGENGNENGPGMQELKIPVKCADFTFDLAQDLLVVVEARARLGSKDCTSTIY